MKTYTLYDQTTGTLIGQRIRCADQSLSRLVGLLGKQHLNAGEGIWIRPSSGVHTFAMLFSIDALGLDGKMQVVRLWPNLRPWRIPLPSLRVKSVVELAAGEALQRGVRLGSILTFVANEPVHDTSR